jgi:haloacid dehalogenase-like hydrolase
LPESQREIALVFDFDDTLAEDSTAAFVKSRGLDPQRQFYDIAAKRVTEGWDPPLAYLSLLCELVRDGALATIKRKDFAKFGSRMKLFPGVPDFLTALRKKFLSEPGIKEAGLSLHYYIVSGGIGDIIRSISIANMFKEIWACELDYDKNGVILRPKAIVSFTEKTKFLFFINKGISGAQSRETPYAVNVDLAPENRPVPFSHMVYVGDGPSDVPCMSVINKAKPPGKCVLVSGPKKIHKSWELLGRGYHAPCDYRKTGFGRGVIEDAVLTTARAAADHIIAEKKALLGKKVGY